MAFTTRCHPAQPVPRANSLTLCVTLHICSVLPHTPLLHWTPDLTVGFTPSRLHHGRTVGPPHLTSSSIMGVMILLHL